METPLPVSLQEVIGDYLIMGSACYLAGTAIFAVWIFTQVRKKHMVLKILLILLQLAAAVAFSFVLAFFSPQWLMELFDDGMLAQVVFVPALISEAVVLLLFIGWGGLFLKKNQEQE